MKVTTKSVPIYCFVLLIYSTVYASPNAKLTAKIVDENQLPIKGAEVTLSFSAAKHGDGGGLTNSGVEGISDNAGVFSGSSETLPYVGVVVDKKGYYRSIQKYEFKSSSLLLNRWEPWNPTIEVVLKKKRNPVAMYINATGTLKVPEFDKPIGYDLERGDWVVPYGNGITSDFVVNIHADSKSYSEYTCNFTLSFSNELDGIQAFRSAENEQSLFSWPFDAPLTGYDKGLSREKVAVPGKGMQSNKQDNIKYIFRVRTKTDKNGNIVSATYGKIPREFNFDPVGNINFAYFFNPDGTRNLEEDPSKNLFKNK